MTESTRVEAPTVDEIEQRFRSPAVVVARPLVLGTLGMLGVVCRYRWTAEGAERLPIGDGPLVFAANHGSHADTAAILGTLPRPLRKRTCVAAALDVFGPTDDTERRTLKALRRECLQVIVAAAFHAFAFDRHGPPGRRSAPRSTSSAAAGACSFIRRAPAAAPARWGPSRPASVSSPRAPAAP